MTLCTLVPITRISEVSRLDPGCAPVFSATTPLAKDLTTHMGKGETPGAARLSAVMEAVERVSAETVHGPTRRASFLDLKRSDNCVNPSDFDLPVSSNFDPARPYNWVAGWDLIARRAVWIPADLCQSPPCEGLLDQVDTNGLASGATYGEAVRHGLMEVIERDAISQHLFFDHYGGAGYSAPPGRGCNADEIPARVSDLIGPHRVEFRDITTDIGVPVIACLLIDQAYPTQEGPKPMTFGGWGCDPVMQIAALRALTEAHQSRIGTLQGTRDSFNIFEDATEHAAAPARMVRSGTDGGSGLAIGRETPFASLAEDVDWCLDRLKAMRIDAAIVINMTDPRLGIPVVRVRVPGLSQYAVDRHRLGWRVLRHIL